MSGQAPRKRKRLSPPFSYTGEGHRELRKQRKHRSRQTQPVTFSFVEPKVTVRPSKAPPTEKQLAFLTDLATELEVEVPEVRTRHDASRAIALLKQTKRRRKLERLGARIASSHGQQA